VAVAFGQDSAKPVCGVLPAPELLDELPPDELLPEELLPEELPPLLEDPAAAGPATTP
jgi:hypothetical protein